jgi:hypothetical protein
MAKFYGAIGYGECEDLGDGVWKDKITEYNYYGDVIRDTRRIDKSDNLNNNINISNTISIIADPFANENFHLIKYISWMNSLWEVVNVEVQRPRLILQIGGVYNGPTPELE